jgi:hypothetical protein
MPSFYSMVFHKYSIKKLTVQTVFCHHNDFLDVKRTCSTIDSLYMSLLSRALPKFEKSGNV